MTTKETKDPFDTADYYSTDMDGDLPMFEAPESAVDDCWANDGPLGPGEGITVYGFRDHDGFCTVIGERYYTAAEVAAIVGEGEI